MAIKPEIKDEPEANVYHKVNKWIEQHSADDQPDDSKADMNLFEDVPIKELDEPRPAKKRKRMNKAQQIELEREEVNRLRNTHKIKISSGGKKGPNENVPDLLESFEQIHNQYQLNFNLRNNLAICGYQQPTPIQMQGIPIMLDKSRSSSLMACAPTGSGKTVTFLVPIIRDILEKRKGEDSFISAIILCPTRELAKQTYRECVRLTEGLPIKTRTLTNSHNAKELKKVDILISTPNSVCYLLQTPMSGEEDESVEDDEAAKITKQPLDLSHLRWFIIDEADKLFEETKNSFRAQLDQIYEHCKSPKLRMALFSATYTQTVATWCKKNVKKLIKVTVGVRNSATETVAQKLLFVGSEDGKLMALRDLIAAGCQPPVLIFVQSKERAKDLFKELVYDGINVDVMHSDRTQAERDDVIRNFRMGKTWFLICTELMSRGIDFKGVNLVVNFDFPTSTISYVHRIGRTGRAERRGEAVTFFTTDDTVNLREIAHLVKNSGSEVPDFMLTLKKRSKLVRKRLGKKAPKRAKITTTPRFERERRAHKKQIIKHSKMKMSAEN